MKKLILSVTSAIFILGCSSQAVAEPQCNTRDSVMSQLKDKYNEEPTAIGVTHNGGLIEVITSPGGKTWSIVITSPQGMSCLVAAGEGWRFLEDPNPASLGQGT